MSDELPEGWASVRIGSAFDCWGGMTPSTSNPEYWGGAMPWVSSKDVKGATVGSGTEFVTRRALEETRLRRCRPGTVLVVVRSGVLAHTLPVAITDREVVVNQDVKALDSGSDDFNRWLALFLRREQQTILEENRKDGTTVQSIRVEQLLGRELPVPPLAEQKRIVENVEALLADVNRARDHLARVPLIVKRFRQSILAAACSGQLTEGWRTAHSSTPAGRTLGELLGAPVPAAGEGLPATWRWVRLGSLITSLRMGTTVPPQNERTAFPVLRSSSVRPGAIDYDDVKFLLGSDSKNPDNFLEEGDLLFTRLSGSLEFVANCAVVRDLNGRRVQYPDRLFRARLVDPSWGPYVEACFASPVLRQSLEVASKSSAGHQRISMGALTEFRVPLPPPAEQAEIVRAVSVLLTAADHIEQRIAQAAAHARAISQSVLARAFSGELVATEAELARAEGRLYEPASELLRRTVSSAQARPAGGRKKRRGSS